MTKVEKVDLKAVAQAEMDMLIEQHNKLVQEMQDANGRLAEVKQQIVEKQGYMKALEDCDAQCKEEK